MNTLHILSLHSVICHIYLKKAGGKIAQSKTKHIASLMGVELWVSTSSFKALYKFFGRNWSSNISDHQTCTLLANTDERIQNSLIWVFVEDFYNHMLT